MGQKILKLETVLVQSHVSIKVYLGLKRPDAFKLYTPQYSANTRPCCSRYRVMATPFCLEEMKEYTIKVEFRSYQSGRTNPQAAILFDSVSHIVLYQGLESSCEFISCCKQYISITVCLTWNQFVADCQPTGMCIVNVDTGVLK